MATDADENDMLTYTLWWGTSETNLSKKNITQEANQGNDVTFTQTDLSNNTTYYFKVSVSDGTSEVTSGLGNQRTWCKGSYCSGTRSVWQNCSLCGGSRIQDEKLYWYIYT